MQVRHISGQRQCTGVRRSALSVAMESGNMSAAPAVDEDTYATSPRKFVLKALDGAEVMLGPERAMRSRLLWSMPASSDTVEFNVPFCKREVHCWLKAMDANSNESCTDCVAAVKVSDFMGDDQTMFATARECARLLVPATVHGKTLASHKRMEACSDVVQALLALGPQVAVVILRQVGSLAKCLHFLPLSCHRIAISAAAEGSKLTLDTVQTSEDETYGCNPFLATIYSTLSDLPSRILSLSVSSLEDGQWMEHLLPKLPMLQRLDIIDCSCAVPVRTSLRDLLPGLTGLRLACDQHRQLDLRDRFTSRLGTLTKLQELEFDTRFCHDIRLLTKPLKSLRLLTHLQIVALDETCQVCTIGQALQSCSSLECLTLDCYKHMSLFLMYAMRDLQQMAGIRSLVLKKWWASPWFFSNLASLTQLEYLDMRGLQGKEAFTEAQHVYSTLQQMTRLQRFNAWKLGADNSISDMCKLLRCLPVTLTHLDLQGNCIPACALLSLRMFVSLRHLSLAHCTLQLDNLADSIPLFPSKLCSLNLSGCRICPASSSAYTTHHVLKFIPQHVTALDLSGSDLSLMNVAQVSRLTELQALRLGEANAAYPGSQERMYMVCLELAASLDCLNQLQAIWLHGGMWDCTEIVAPVMDCIAVLPSLTSISFVRE